MISKHILKITFLNKPELVFQQTVQCFYLISNNSVKHKYSFCLYIVKCQTVLFQTIQFSISTQFFFVYTQLNVKTVNFKQFNLA